MRFVAILSGFVGGPGRVKEDAEGGDRERERQREREGGRLEGRRVDTGHGCREVNCMLDMCDLHDFCYRNASGLVPHVHADI